MNVEKKVIGHLEKCYSLQLLNYNKKQHLLVAAEKVNQCLLYDLDGNLEETIWEEPGGVMSMVQVPETNGQFLATQRFYSPNDSESAAIVVVTPDEHGTWEVRTLVDLPFVHRFDILVREGVQYLIACTVKSGNQFKDDWSSPGKVYVAELPKDLSIFHTGHQLELHVLKEDMLKNHGYYRDEEEGIQSAVVSCDSGVYQFIPPERRGQLWEINCLTSDAASDGLLLDIDGDGTKELITIAPFHGDTVTFYRKEKEGFRKEYSYPEKLEFLHAMYGGRIGERATFICGCRKGNRKLLAFVSSKSGTYEAISLDEGCGAANVLCYRHHGHHGKDILIAANREINEIAMYTFF